MCISTLLVTNKASILALTLLAYPFIMFSDHKLDSCQQLKLIMAIELLIFSLTRNFIFD